MSEEHNISWICLVTEAGCTMRVPLDADCEPVAHFTLEKGDKPKAAYAYCNLHGFWKTEADSPQVNNIKKLWKAHALQSFNHSIL